MSGCIYICPTPIGNLEDITLRALRVLKECDCIFCEDTRHTAILLRHYEIRKPLISYHKFNAQFRAAELIQRAQKGEQVVLVSDAGMPGVSDPGFEAVRAAREAGVSVTVLPGASASLCGLLLSGLPCDRFVFEGFLPTTGKARRMQIEALRSEKRTVILYESPHRLERTLCELFSALGERTVAVAREISKLYEECINFPLQE